MIENAFSHEGVCIRRDTLEDTCHRTLEETGLPHLFEEIIELPDGSEGNCEAAWIFEICIDDMVIAVCREIEEMHFKRGLKEHVKRNTLAVEVIRDTIFRAIRRFTD